MSFFSNRHVSLVLKAVSLLLMGIAFSGCIRALDADGSLGDEAVDKGYESSRVSNREWK